MDDRIAEALSWTQAVQIWITERGALLQDALQSYFLFQIRAPEAVWTFLLANSQALNHLAVFVIGAIGIPLLWIRTRAADGQAKAAYEQARTAEQGHITDRFTKAIEQLGSEKMAVRLGAIYALERLSKDSPEDHWTIMEVLTAYVRDNAPWPPKEIVGYPFVDLQTDAEEKKTEPRVRPATDLQAAITVLGRRSFEVRKQDERLNRRINLGATDLRGADLREAKLSRAVLIRANLRKASLFRADLQRTYLWWANLRHAVLVDAKLQGASLYRTKLQGAELGRANLQRAVLRKANLQGARLRGADLQGARLHGADLGSARYLTQEQLDAARGDEHTILPTGPGLTRPPHWLKPEACPTDPLPPPETPNPASR